MAAHPLPIDAAAAIRRALSCSPGIFTLRRIVGKGNGCAVEPFVTFGVAIAKIETSPYHVESRGRILKRSIREIRRSGSIVIHSPRADVFSAHVCTLDPYKAIDRMQNLGSFGEPLFFTVQIRGSRITIPRVRAACFRGCTRGISQLIALVTGAMHQTCVRSIFEERPIHSGARRGIRLPVTLFDPRLPTG